MGQGICSNDFVGKRDLQESFRLFFGGASELPIDIRRRLDNARKKNRRKKNSDRLKKKLSQNHKGGCQVPCHGL